MRAIAFRLMKPGQIDYGDPRQVLPHQPVRFQQPRQALPCTLGLHGQQLAGGRHQLFLRQEAVARRQVVIQFKQNARFHPPGVIPRHTQLNGKTVHRPEGGVQPLVHQQIRVIVQ